MNKKQKQLKDKREYMQAKRRDPVYQKRERELNAARMRKMRHHNPDGAMPLGKPSTKSFFLHDDDELDFHPLDSGFFGHGQE